MSTRALVPNASGEGSLGTADKAWGAMYVNTPATGANDQSVPSTAWVQSVIAAALKQAKLDAHPVGSYYFSDDSTSPADLFGGTWEALPAGYTLIAQGSGTDDFGSYTYTAGQKYGERMHKLTVEELASHTHPQNINGNGSDGWNGSYGAMTTNGAGSDGVAGYSASLTGWKDASRRIKTDAAGKSSAHNNIQPVMAVYAWRRQA